MEPSVIDIWHHAKNAGATVEQLLMIEVAAGLTSKEDAAFALEVINEQGALRDGIDALIYSYVMGDIPVETAIKNIMSLLDSD